MLSTNIITMRSPEGEKRKTGSGPVGVVWSADQFAFPPATESVRVTVFPFVEVKNIVDASVLEVNSNKYSSTPLGEIIVAGPDHANPFPVKPPRRR